MNRLYGKYIVIIMFILLLISGCKKKEIFIYYYNDNNLVNTLSVGSELSYNYRLQDTVQEVFVGWELNGELVSNFDFKEDTKLNARFERPTYDLTYVVDGNVVENCKVLRGESLSLLEYGTNEYYVTNWMFNGVIVEDGYVVNSDMELISVISNETFKINAKESVVYGDVLSVNVVRLNKFSKMNLSYEVDNEIAYITSESNSGCLIETYGTGIVNLKVTDALGYEVVHTFMVVGDVYNIDYVLEDGVSLSFEINSFDTSLLPVKLPTASLQNAIFLGWSLDESVDLLTEITYESMICYDITLTPVFVYPRLELSFTKGNSTLCLNEIATLNVQTFNVPSSLLEDGFIITSSNENVCSIDGNDILSKALGYSEILVSLKAYPSICVSIGMTVIEVDDGLENVFNFFNKINETQIIAQKILVVGWQETYYHNLIGSVTGVLFEELKIIENIASLSNSNRPGIKRDKYYICVHDTGDAEYTAKQWSDTVFNEYNEQGNGSKYEASFQYVIGNDGCYHNIPDDEVSYHAGDGSREYELLPSGVKGNNLYPSITISVDGYYEIDGAKTKIIAPTYNGKILSTKDINDCGVRCVVVNGEYYLGKTWYSSTYRKISNVGGNRNSIGIESCINKGSDIYLTWQMLAKLVAKLMDDFALTIDDIVPHHYFSGKNCPQTMRGAGMWNYFKTLCDNEYQLLQFKKMGYTITMEPLSDRVLNNGRIKNLPNSGELLKYQITVEKNGVKNSVVYTTYAPSNSLFK